MEINKENYEAYFLDYHEGNLSPEQVAELMLFLEQHPKLQQIFNEFENISINEEATTIALGNDFAASLKKQIPNENNFEEWLIAKQEGLLNNTELDLLEQFVNKSEARVKTAALYLKTKLIPEAINFNHKQALYKTELPVSAENAEVYFSADADGTLSDVEKKSLNLFLNNNASFKSVHNAYLNTRLTVDTSINYPGKNALKKRNTVISLFSYVASAAAAIALLLGVYSIMKTDESIQGDALLSYQHNAVIKNNLLGDSEKQVVSNLAPENNSPKSTNVKQIVKPNLFNDTNQVIIQNPVLVKNDTANKKTEILYAQSNPENSFISNKYTPEEEVINGITATQPEYLTFREVLAMNVKNKILKKEMDDETLYREDKKKLTWYDAGLIVSKGISKLLGREVGFKKRYDDNGTLVAYQLNAGRYVVNKPVEH